MRQNKNYKCEKNSIYYQIIDIFIENLLIYEQIYVSIFV